MKRKLIIFLVAGILIGLVGSQWFSERNKNSQTETKSENQSKIKPDLNADDSENSDSIVSQIPSNVYTILKYVTTFHQPKAGYIGGKTFHNYENKLPKEQNNGLKIHYQEWDVNPKRNRINRGKERLVTGDDHSAWYTNNHYKSFNRIK